MPAFGGRAEMGKIDTACEAIRDAAAMRFEAAPMHRPDLLHGRAHPQLGRLQPIGQPHVLLERPIGGSSGPVLSAVAWKESHHDLKC
jgi:hypothetical protein